MKPSPKRVFFVHRTTSLNFRPQNSKKNTPIKREKSKSCHKTLNQTQLGNHWIQLLENLPTLGPLMVLSGNAGACIGSYLDFGELAIFVATMLLAGIAVNALAGALMGYVIYLADDNQLRTMTFWTLGSLSHSTWKTVNLAAPFLLISILILPFFAKALNALLLGEDEAGHLGFDPDRTKRICIILTALIVGASVAVSGTIGFVGLVVPHLLRLILGPDNRGVLIGSALLGAIVLLLSDLVARTIAAPSELPLGVITASVGAPFFLYLLLRSRKEYGF
jgi:ABC-type Fe3+-siderophore transport system permease subunit